MGGWGMLYLPYNRMIGFIFCLSYNQMIGYILIVVVLAVIFRKRIQQWLDGLEGPIGRLRNDRNEEPAMQGNHYNYAQMEMPAQNINYANPNSNYQYVPPQNPPIYPHVYQYNQPNPPPAYYMPPQPNPYETHSLPQTQSILLNDNDIQRRINGSGVNPYIK